MTDERHRLPGLVDLPRDVEDLGGPPHLIRCEPPRNYKTVEPSSLHLLDVHVNRDRVASLPLIRALPQARNGRDHTFLFQPDLGVPQLQVLIQRSREEKHFLPYNRHATYLG